MRVKESLKSSFLAGAVLVAPLVATLVILRFLSNILASQLEPIVQSTRLASYTADNFLLAQLLALAVILVVVTLLGAFARRPFGQHVLGRTGRLVGFVPVVRTIYGSIRQMASSVATQSSEFDRAVYVEYERRELYRLGLQTGTSPRDLEDVAGEPARNVFVPGSPNPTQGALLLVPESRVYDADLTVREAIRILMTTGMADGTNDAAIGLSVDELPFAEARTGDEREDESPVERRDDVEPGNPDEQSSGP